MNVEVEMVAAVIRVYKDNCSYGEPYEWAATLSRIDHVTVEVMGVNKVPNRDERIAIGKKMKELGYKKIIWWRYRGDKKVLIEINLDDHYNLS